MSFSPYLLFRAFCESDTPENARFIANALCERLSQIGHSTIERVEPYWKIPGAFEICICLEAVDGEDVLISNVKDLFNVTWSTEGGLMVWKRIDDSAFDSLPLIWASSEYVIPPSPSD